MRWFRLHTEVKDDPKVQRLPADLFKAWVNTLCLAAEHDGRIPPLPDYAYALRLTEEAALHIEEQLKAKGLLDEDEHGLMPHNWSWRQFKSDNSTERVRKFREKKRQEEEIQKQSTDTETDTEEKRSPKQPGNVSSGDTETLTWFENFWELYPRKVAKPAALKAAKSKASTEAKRAQILAGLQAHLPELQSREERYVPHPATWLNQERWADAPEHPGPQASGNSRPRDRHQAREEQARRTCREIISRRLGNEIQPNTLADGE